LKILFQLSGLSTESRGSKEADKRACRALQRSLKATTIIDNNIDDNSARRWRENGAVSAGATQRYSTVDIRPHEQRKTTIYRLFIENIMIGLAPSRKSVERLRQLSVFGTGVVWHPGISSPTDRLSARDRRIRVRRDLLGLSIQDGKKRFSGLAIVFS
jgi:hypothetical protein